MADDLPLVKPGEFITAEKWNALVARVTGLATAGPVTVPSLFGRALADARAIIQMPGSMLNVSQVFDAFGQSVDPNDSANAQRRVLSQTPIAGAQVPEQTGVSLVVAAVPGGIPSNPLPEIAGIDPASQQETGFVVISGQNFDTPAQLNTVLFDGEPSTPDNGTSIALHVKVPLGVSGVPASGGSRANVPVVVKKRSSQESVPFMMTVQSPPAVQPPAITSIAPQSGPLGFLGQPIVITGSNFGASLSAVRVFFDGDPATGVAPSAGSSTSLTVTPPTSLAKGFSGSTHAYAVTVKVGDQTSGAVQFTLMVP
jgi:hypothetical protein